MLKQAENRVKVEGILSEIDINPTSFKKNGRDVEAIGGSIIVKVIQKISGVEKEDQGHVWKDGYHQQFTQYCTGA